MSALEQRPSPRALARLAGVFYLVIIVCGLSSEVVVRAQLVVAGDAAQTAANILAAPSLFRVGFLCDAVMTLSDVILAVLLYVVFSPAGRTLALTATALRLVQAAILGLNLLNYAAAILILTGADYLSVLGGAQTEALALFFLDLHRHGYDLGLIFFGVQCAVFGWLMVKSGYVPKILGILMILSSMSYLLGSFALFLAPAKASAIGTIYAIPVIAELSFCLWLLIKGVRVPGTGEMS